MKKFFDFIFLKTAELIGLSFVKLPLRSSAILYIVKDAKYCFLWSILAKLHPISNPEKGQSTRFSIFRQR